MVAQEIDLWHADAGPFQPGGPGVGFAHERAYLQLEKNGRFNLQPQLGQVIPRLASGSRRLDPDYAAAFEPGTEATKPLYGIFKSIIVIPTHIAATEPDDCAIVGRREVALDYRIVRAIHMGKAPAVVPAGQPSEQKPFIVGFAPLGQARDDIAIEDLIEDSLRWYDAQPIDLGARAAQAVEALCKAGANVIIFPEATMHASAHASLRAAIAEFGYRSQLRLVIAGSTPRDNRGGKPFNEAILYDARGAEIGRQSKLHRWNLDEGQRRPLGLAPDMPADQKLFERITPGDSVTIFEMPGLGRLVVMICEDLSRSEPGAFLRSNLMLDWVFTPILDKSIESWRWMAQEFGKRAAQTGRCRVAVGNSLSLTHRLIEAGILPRETPCGAAVCIDWVPDQPDPDAVDPEYAPPVGKVRYFLWHVGLTEAAPSLQLPWTPDQWTEFTPDE
ncbi:MAG: nitrilase-related carbon-nitrogen hydrolase [Sphingomonas sp.]